MAVQETDWRDIRDENDLGYEQATQSSPATGLV